MENGSKKKFFSVKHGEIWQPASPREDSHTGSKSPKRQKIIGVDIDPQLEACVFSFFSGEGEAAENERGRNNTKGAFFFVVGLGTWDFGYGGKPTSQIFVDTML